MSRAVKFLIAGLVALTFAFGSAQDAEPTVSFTLVGGIGGSGFEFMGVGGDIDGIRNPDLNVKVGDVVEIILINGDGMTHDWVVQDTDLASDKVSVKDESVRFVFTATEAGTFIYLCTEPGHALPEFNVGMFGNLIVSE
ncbi:MAG: hypothetical protein KF813_10470 [Trueperaceae bacterium]|nr:hypothetical protein [Trueperaceae bacterium]